MNKCTSAWYTCNKKKKLVYFMQKKNKMKNKRVIVIILINIKKVSCAKSRYFKNYNYTHSTHRLSYWRQD